MDCEHKSYVLLYQMHWSYSVVVGDNHNDSLQPATSSTIAKKHAEPQRVTSNTQQATGNKESWYTLNLAKTHAEPQRVTSNTQQATGRIVDTNNHL